MHRAVEDCPVGQGVGGVEMLARPEHARAVVLPHFSSGRPTTAISWTAGWRNMTPASLPDRGGAEGRTEAIHAADRAGRAAGIGNLTAVVIALCAAETDLNCLKFGAPGGPQPGVTRSLTVRRWLGEIPGSRRWPATPDGRLQAATTGSLTVVQLTSDELPIRRGIEWLSLRHCSPMAA
jgi:hypothetical protein